MSTITVTVIWEVTVEGDSRHAVADGTGVLLGADTASILTLGGDDTIRPQVLHDTAFLQYVDRGSVVSYTVDVHRQLVALAIQVTFVSGQTLVLGYALDVRGKAGIQILRTFVDSLSEDFPIIQISQEVESLSVFLQIVDAFGHHIS